MADVLESIDSTGSTLFDNILTACLYLGAAFQLICIFSVIILPEREGQTSDDAPIEKANGDMQPDAYTKQPTKEQHTNSGLKNRRHEKKKKK